MPMALGGQARVFQMSGEYFRRGYAQGAAAVACGKIASPASIRSMNYRRPVLLHNLGVSVAGLRVHRARLHREAPEEKMEAHHHDHDQFFLVLKGRLRIAIGDKEHHGHAGSVMLVPAETTHEIRIAYGEDPPFCLVVDLRLLTDQERVDFQAQLGLPDLRACRTLLERLLELEEPERAENRLLAGSVLLGVLDVPLRALGWIREVRAKVGRSAARITTKSVERFLEKDDLNASVSPSEIARRLGYDLRQINRILKKECQLSLGQVRARYRLRRSQQLLRMGKRVADAGAAVGFEDSNYFTRWFRRQTGMTPRQWDRSGRPPEALLSR